MPRMTLRAMSSTSIHASVVISPAMMATPVLTMVSQATRARLSCARMASSMASDRASATLSGCPSETDSEVNSVVVMRLYPLLRIQRYKEAHDTTPGRRAHQGVPKKPPGASAAGDTAPCYRRGLCVRMESPTGAGARWPGCGGGLTLTLRHQVFGSHMFEHIVKPVPGSSAGTHRRLSAGAWVAGLVAAVLLGASAGAQAAGRTADAPAAFGSSTIDTLLAQARQRYHAAQAIFVVADAADGPRAELSTYAYEEGHWSRVMGPVPAVLGKNGTSLHRHEGDMKSPAGIFRMGRAFGSQPEPAGVSLPYTRTTKYDYWVDDVSS